MSKVSRVIANRHQFSTKFCASQSQKKVKNMSWNVVFNAFRLKSGSYSNCLGWQFLWSSTSELRPDEEAVMWDLWGFEKSTPTLGAINEFHPHFCSERAAEYGKSM
jgi:hypothetical protein